ncbi:MAG: Ig-like domain-containing protein, partial [Xenococcaceae cyanobacterium MO_234.B1]|nr:Ig-like domain-containing protein [Xenococcaceae cyanobacterium MO_234.B1]
KSFTQPSNGEVKLNNNGTPDDKTDDKLVYIPNEGFTGTDTFTYAVADPSGAMDMATVTIEVVDPNPAPEITANLVGTTSIYEGDQGTYKIQLDSASDRDHTFTIQVEDGTANRVDEYAPNQDIIWGGFYDIRNSSGEVIKVVEDRVPNGTDPDTGDRPATGPGDASWDYTVYQDNSINVGDTITVTVAAGQTMSDSFEIQAWLEQVTVDRDGPNSKNFLEGTENFSINVVGKDNTVFHQDSLQVEILDKTDYGFVSPIVIDLNGDGVKTISIDQGVMFDMDNDGVAENTGWLSRQDGFLAIDKNGNRKIDNQNELFGGEGTRGAFEKLASYDSNKDGVVNALDDNFGQILVWQDANENGLTDTYKDPDLNELKSLSAAGVSELSLDYQSDFSLDDQGNILGETSTAVVNGETRDLIDVYF